MAKTESQKVHEIYGLIGERGLYVNTNLDLFGGPTKDVTILTSGYTVQLADKETYSYASPLLFAALTSLLNYGTMLITGAPGIGKTTSAEYAGHFFSGVPLDKIIQAELLGNPNLTEEKTIAYYDTAKLIKEGVRSVIPTEFLRCPVKIWDEINRTPPDLLSVAMKLVDTGKATYQGVTLKSAVGPLFATANYSDEGTFQLTAPFLDRFDIAVMVTSPPASDLEKIRNRGDEKLGNNLENLLEIPEGLKINNEQIKKEINALPEQTEKGIGIVYPFIDFIYANLRFSEIASDNILRATKGNAWSINQDNAPTGHFQDHTSTYTINELSIRTIRAIQRYAKAFAWFTGKDKITIKDVETILPYALWHKIQPTKAALEENAKFSNDRISFVRNLTKSIKEEYYSLLSDANVKFYYAALDILKDGKFNNQDLNIDQVNTITSNAIERLGRIDKVWALILINHLANEYNLFINKKNEASNTPYK